MTLIQKRKRFRLSLAVLAVPLAAMPLTLTPSAVRAQSAPPGATPEKVKDGLAYLDKAAQDIIQKGGVPGMSIAVVYNDEVVYLKGFGVREAGKPETVDGDTVFQIASLSKPISATVISRLVGEGIVSWDDKVSQRDPDLAFYEPFVTKEATIRDFFCHRSGLMGTAGDDLEVMGYDRQQCLYRQRFLKPSSSIRTQYSYSNIGITTGAIAAVRPTGKTWEEVADEKLFKPLGMTATSYRNADFLTRKNRSSLHVNPNGKWEAKFTRNPDVQAPAGAVNSTASDLARWMRLHLNAGKFDGKQLIPADVIAQVHVPQMFRGPNPVSGYPDAYCLGWAQSSDALGRIYWNHAGAFSVGARTNAKMLPSSKLGIVVLTNAFPTGVPDGLCDAFFDQVLNGSQSREWVSLWTKGFSGLFGAAEEASKPYFTPLPNPAPVLPLSAYVGTYQSEYFGPIEIKEQGGVLTFYAGPKKRAYPLRHWNRDTFLLEADPELPKILNTVAFLIGPDKKAQRVIAEHLDSYGQGEFVRAP